MIRLTAGVAVMSLLGGSAVAQVPDPTCFSDAELADILVSLAPAALDDVGKQCAAVLQNGLVIGNPESSLAKKLGVASREAWPRAYAAMVRFGKSKGWQQSDPSEPTFTLKDFSEGVTPPLGTLIKDPDNCTAVDKMLKLAEALPPQNLAGVLVQIVHVTGSRADKKNICPAAR